MARNDPQMNLRVPADLKEKIERAAFENNRTITAEAVERLEQSFVPADDQVSRLHSAFMKLHHLTVEQNSKIGTYEYMLKEQSRMMKELMAKVEEVLMNPDD